MPRASVGDVLDDGAAEQPGVLEHHSHAGPQIVSGHGRDINAVKQNSSGVDFVEAHQQVDQSGLTGAGRSHDRDRLAGFDTQRQSFDHRLAGE